MTVAQTRETRYLQVSDSGLLSTSGAIRVPGFFLLRVTAESKVAARAPAIVPSFQAAGRRKG